MTSNKRNVTQPKERPFHVADMNYDHLKKKFNANLSPLKWKRKADFQRRKNYDGTSPGNLINELNIYNEVHINKRNNYFNTPESKFRINKQTKVGIYYNKIDNSYDKN